MLDYNIYDILKIHMFNNKKGIKKEANWIISNIASDTEAHIKDLIDNGFFKSKILQANDLIINQTKKGDGWYLGSFTIQADTKLERSE